MKKFVAIVSLALLAAGFAAAQFVPGGGNTGANPGSMAPPPPKKQPTTRQLSGKIMDQNDDPLASAVVYLKDPRTKGVRTYISNNDGSYLFAGLAQNQDYEIFAEYKGTRSPSKTFSAFDSRAEAQINLHVNVKK